jgi:hypothetical protein
LPSKDDFSTVQIEIDKDVQSNDNESKIYLRSSHSIEFDDVTSSYYPTKPEKGAITLWTADSYPDFYEYWKTVTIKKGIFGVSVNSSHAQKSFGFKVIGVGEIEFSLENKVFDFKCFMNANSSFLTLVCLSIVLLISIL